MDRTQAGGDGPDLAGDPTLASDRAPGLPTRELATGAAIGRYIVLQQIGAGGMGVVYAAYDPRLDRKIAVKLLHESGPVGQERLLREAQAIARLDHPNVVAVHDVGTVDEAVFVAMEFVDGWTLTRWLRRGDPKPWRAILDRLIRAGRGLASAHSAGLVHRDFKPDNVLISRDDRVLVVDFGLARAADGPTAPDGPDTSDARASTMTGTPAYMAPELLNAGTRADARADQYAFCVTVYEALYGQHPFEWGSVVELAVRAADGEIRKPTGRTLVPSRIRDAIVRGLRPRPGDRWPSVEELLHELVQGGVDVRRRWLTIAITVAVVVAALGLSFWLSVRSTSMCANAEAKLEGVWDVGKQRAGEAAFAATELHYAADAWSRGSQRLDAYAANWVAMREQACRATYETGEQPADLLDLRMECLDDRLGQLRAVVDLLVVADARVVERSAHMVAGLGYLGRCADAEALRSLLRPPDPSTRGRVEAVREQLHHVGALRTAGRYVEAIDKVSAVVARASEIGYAPLHAEALLMEGWLATDLDQHERAEDRLERAVWLARAAGDERTTADATSLLVTEVGYELGRTAEAVVWARHGLAGIQRLSPGPERDQRDAFLSIHIGNLLFRTGDFEAALHHFKRALQLLERSLGVDFPATSSAMTNIAVVLNELGHVDEARAYIERALALTERAWGAEHPALIKTLNSLAVITQETDDFVTAAGHMRRAIAIQAKIGEHAELMATLHANLGALLLEMGRREESRESLEQSVRILEARLGPNTVELRAALGNLGLLAAEQGDREAARAYYYRVRSIAERFEGPDHPNFSRWLMSMGNVDLEAGEHDRARREFERALAHRERVLGPRHPYVAHSLERLANVYGAVNDPATASELFERALSIRELGSPVVDLGMTRFGLAQSLWDAGRQRERALRLARFARTEVGRGLGDQRKRLAKIDAWLTERDVAD